MSVLGSIAVNLNHHTFLYYVDPANVVKESQSPTDPETNTGDYNANNVAVQYIPPTKIAVQSLVIKTA
jgi:hypothetical protein